MACDSHREMGRVVRQEGPGLWGQAVRVDFERIRHYSAKIRGHSLFLDHLAGAH